MSPLGVGFVRRGKNGPRNEDAQAGRGHFADRGRAEPLIKGQQVLLWDPVRLVEDLAPTLFARGLARHHP